jgi:hypothetical protein
VVGPYAFFIKANYHEMKGHRLEKKVTDLKERSPRAMMRLARMTGSAAFSSMVKMSWRCFSQNSEETSMNLVRARLALALHKKDIKKQLSVLKKNLLSFFSRTKKNKSQNSAH